MFKLYRIKFKLSQLRTFEYSGYFTKSTPRCSGFETVRVPPSVTAEGKEETLND